MGQELKGYGQEERDARPRRALDDVLQFGILHWTLLGGVTDANDAFLRMLGYTRGDLEAGRIDWFALTPEESRSADADGMMQVRKTGRHAPFEKQFVHRDGSRVSVLIGSALYPDSEYEGVSFVLDFSGREAEERGTLEQKVQVRVAGVLESITDAFVAVDADWTITYMNAEAERLMGQHRNEFIGKSHWDVWPASVGTELERQYRKVVTERTPAHFENLYDDGQIRRWYEVRAFPATGGGVNIFYRDITADKDAQAAVERAQQQLRLVTDAAPLLISYVGADFRYSFVNQAYTRWFGRPASEIVGRHAEEVLGPAAFAAVRPHLTAVLAGQRVSYDAEIPYLHGGWRYVHTDLVPDMAEDGVTVRGFVAVVVDMTDRKKSERRETFLAEMTERTRFSDDPEAVLYEAARMAGEFTGASRALFGEVNDAPGGDPDAATISVHRDFVQYGAPSIAGMTRPLLSFGRAIIDSLRAGNVTASEDIATDPRVLPEHRAAFAELGIRAFVGAPIHKDSRWVSLLVLHHSEPRAWPGNERDLLAEVAERTRLAVDNARLQRDQMRAAERLRLAAATAGLGAWEMDLTPSVWVNTLDARTVALFGRASAHSDGPLTVVGSEWAYWIHPDDREQVLSEFASALSGAGSEYQMQYRALWPDKQTVRWISALGTIQRDEPTNRPLRVIGMCRDITDEKEAAQKQRRFLREMLFGMTEGRLRLCDSPTDLPAELPPVCDPVELTVLRLRLLRKQVEAVTEESQFARERMQDLETAVGEAAMNAVKHGAGKKAGRVHADTGAGTIQVWIEDEGTGIAEHLIHRAVEIGWTTGGFGQGFHLMWRTCDRVYLLTGPEGTTVVLEQDRLPPPPLWL